MGNTVVANGTFDQDSDWLKDAPWSIGSGVASHAGGPGYIYQNSVVQEYNYYLATYDITSLTSGVIRAYFGTAFNYSPLAAGSYINTNMSNNATAFFVWSNGTASIDNVVVKKITLSNLFSMVKSPCLTRKMVVPPVSVLTAGTQAGAVAACDSASNPQNYVFSYCDGSGSVVTDQVVAGVRTNLNSTVVAFSAAKHFSFVLSGTSLDVYYSAADFGTKITTVTLHADVAAGLYCGMFSAYAGNKFSVASTPFSLSPYV